MREYKGDAIKFTLGPGGSNGWYRGQIKDVNTGIADEVVVAVEADLTSSVLASSGGGAVHDLDGQWVRVHRAGCVRTDERSKVFGRVLRVVDGLVYVMDHGSGDVETHTVLGLDGAVVDEEVVLGSAGRREIVMKQTDFWSMERGVDHSLGIRERSGRCDGCGGVKVGWVIGIRPCYLCKQSGGPIECCIRCGNQAHVREQVYVNGANEFGHHVVHKGVKWVTVDSDGVADVKSCKGVHVGRWVGGMCPMCCSEVSSARMDAEGGGWASEAVRDRTRARDELVATNIESTQARVAGHVERRLQRSGVVGSSAGRTSERAHSRGAGMADSLMCRDGGAAEMEICSGSCVMLRL